MVILIGFPLQPAAVGVTVYTTVPVELPVVDKVWTIDVALPLEAPETPDGETVQLKIVPPIELNKEIEVVPPEHIVCEVAEAEATGPGLTVTVVF